MMNRNGLFSIATACRVLCTVAALAAWGSPALAAVVNKYTFNNNTAEDSVGGAHGNIVDNTGIAMFVGGAIDLTANTTGSNQDFSLPGTIGAYVNLPDNTFRNAVTSSANGGSASVEIWFTTQQNRAWAEVVSLGTSAAGADLSTGGGSYLAIIPSSGTTPAEFRGTTRDTGGQENYILAPPPGLPALPTAIKQHVVMTLDHGDTTAGANGTVRMYLNGAQVGNGAQAATFFDTISDVNNWLGRSQWPDALYDGTIDEFRIYNNALTASEVTTSFTTGPEAVSLPVLVVDRGSKTISLANQSASNVQVKGYSILSTNGTLDPTKWDSIDDDNTFDTNGVWTAQSSTSTNLSESVTSGTLDGGVIAPSTSREVGDPLVPTPPALEDIQFNFTLSDGTTGSGLVQYTGAAFARSDLNGDGSITVADWTQFLQHSFTTFTTDTAAVAYSKGDLSGDKDNDYQDFQLFKADYNAVNGAGTFEQLSGMVPEPSSLALAALAMLAVSGRRRRLL